MACETPKPFEDFWTSPLYADGHLPRCVPCHKAFDEERRAALRKKVHGEGCDCEPCITGVKRCCACDRTKPRDEFGACATAVDGLVGYCKVCSAHRNRMTKYRMDEETYLALFEAQNGCCAICDKPFGDATPHVDHNHACCPGTPTCGQCSRGLVCGNCNKALGLINDDPNRAMAMASYLISFEDVLGKII